MTLGQFKQLISESPEGTIFNYGISEPFSWRGIYAEVAFSFSFAPMSKESILRNINKALSDSFYGWKGGDYSYNEYTEVHFEDSHGSYTDGVYCAHLISKIQEEPQYQSQEHRLAYIAFTTPSK